LQLPVCNSESHDERMIIDDSMKARRTELHRLQTKSVTFHRSDSFNSVDFHLPFLSTIDPCQVYYRLTGIFHRATGMCVISLHWDYIFIPVIRGNIVLHDNFFV
jgi:hypothetical protein